jgi:arylsulfatase A-like enzyme
MLKNKRTWIIALALVLLVAGGSVALAKTLGDDGSGTGEAKVTLPADPVGSGADEPGRLRVYVDNSGPVVSVSARTARRPWTKSMKVVVGGTTTTLERGKELTRPCDPAVTAEPSSLLTRLDFRRACLKGDTATVDATVSVDGGDPVERSAARTRKPNVLMIMVDDMRTDELKWMPNVQKLIGDQGVTFNNGFASFPLCCPARSSVVTGQYPHNHGVWSHEPPWGFSALRDKSTFPVWLQKAGYYTTYLGKYLNGYGTEPEPGRKTGKSTQYCPPGWDLWRGSIDGGLPPEDPNDGGTYRYFDTTLNDNCNGYVSLKGTYQTTAYTQIARDQLTANAAQDKPWFSYVSYTAPHHGAPAEEDDPDYMVTPARPKRIWGAFDKYIKKAPGADWLDPDRSDKPTRITKSPPNADMKAQMLEATRQRAESIYLVDESIGKIMKRLKDTGQLRNTVVVFTSDNGYFLGEQGERQGKILPYEPSLRVPVVMRGPGIPRGEVRTDPFLSIDYAETFSDLGDARPTSSVDGHSMVDIARLGDESAGSTWSRVVLTETKPTDAVQIKLLQQQKVGAHTRKMLRAKTTGIRTGRYLYTEWLVEPGDDNPGATVELYDVLKDPNEYVNMAMDPDKKALVAELHDVLAKARRCQGDECRVLLPENLR